MISEYEDGGLKMIDIRLFIQVLKLNWVEKYLDTGNHAKWKLFFNLQLRDLNCTVTSCFWDNFKQRLLNNETSLRSLELTPSLVIGLKPHPFLRKYVYFLFLICTKRIY